MAATNVDPITGQPVIDVVLPTFRLEPEEDERFYPSKAKAIAEQVMQEELHGMEYDEEESKNWGLNISDKVRELVQGNNCMTCFYSKRICICMCVYYHFKFIASLGIPRFKIVVQTTVSQLRDQGIRVASRCLWNVSTDNYASASFKNVSFFLFVCIFCVCYRYYFPFIYTDLLCRNLLAVRLWCFVFIQINIYIMVIQSL